MSFFHKKVLCSVLLFGGLLIGLSPYIFATVTGNEYLINNNSILFPLALVGLGLIITASIFQKSAFYCTGCNKPLTSHRGGPANKSIGGLIGIVLFLRMKECPHCHKKLS